jgi:hypothetical protein
MDAHADGLRASYLMVNRTRKCVLENVREAATARDAMSSAKKHVLVSLQLLAIADDSSVLAPFSWFKPKD